MRNRFPPTRYIPEGSEEVKHPEGLGVVYTYKNEKGQPLAVAYAGKAAKPAWHHRFQTEERRAEKIAELWANLEAHRTVMAERREADSAPVDARVGDILHTSWGYDQTNVEYFEVVAVRGKVVDLRELAQEVVRSTGWLQEVVKPVPGRYLDKPALCGKRPKPLYDNRKNTEGRAEYQVRIDYCRTAWLGGEERHTSSYA